MNLLSDLKNWIIAIGGLLLAILSAYFVGSRSGTSTAKKAAEQAATTKDLQRQAAEQKGQIDAVDTRAEVERETNTKADADVRKELADRWTRRR